MCQRSRNSLEHKSARMKRILYITIAFIWMLAPARAEVMEICTEADLRDQVAFGGLIEFRCSSDFTNFTLTRPIIISKDTTLQATNEVVISGGLTTRLFIVNPGVNFRLENITLFSGRQSPTNLSNGGISAIAGAAIYNNGGNVTIINGRLQSHSLTGIKGTDGANGSEGDDGQDGGDAAGGAIYNAAGTLMISNTVFEANSVTGGVGGKGGNGGSGIGGDGGDGGNGGVAGGAAIFSDGGTVTILNSTFTNNVAKGALAGLGGSGTGILGFNGIAGQAGDASGGAIAGRNAAIQISGCTFVANQVMGANGADGVIGLRNLEGDPGRNGGNAAGGAIYSTGNLSVTNSTFYLNSATGGNGGVGGAGGSGSFGEDGGRGGDGGVASGGAVEATALSTIIHATFSNNSLTGGTAGTGGAGGGVLGEEGSDGSTGATLGAAINAPGARVNIANSILATASAPLISGAIFDLGGNLTTESNSILNPDISFLRRSPRLSPLANNGGPTATMALSTNSPAVDKGVSAYCVLTDQRGSNRVAGCDIGAYEIIGPVTNIVIAPPPTNFMRLQTTFALSNANLSLLWPTGYTNVYLQFSTNLSQTNWTIAGNKFEFQGTNNLFKVSATNVPRLFFRLEALTNISLTDTNFFPPPPGGGGPPSPGGSGGPPIPQ